MTNTDDASLDDVIDAARRRYGQRALFRGRGLRPPAVPVLPTGFAEVDGLLGIGGLPQGRITELIGTGTSGRGTLVARTLALAQRAGRQAVYVDLARSIDLDTLARAEVSFDGLVILRPLGFGHALEMIRDLLTEGSAGVIVLDRLDGRSEGPERPDPDLLDRALREWNTLLSRSLCALIVLTEVLSPHTYPSDYTLPYFASVRLDLAWQGWLAPAGPPAARDPLTGFTARVTVLKNKLWSSEGRSLVVRVPVLEG
jgi:recombination protein RecA